MSSKMMVKYLTVAVVAFGVYNLGFADTRRNLPATLSTAATTVNQQEPVMELEKMVLTLTQALQAGNTKTKSDAELQALVRKIVVPQFDMDAVARAVLGSPLWDGAQDKDKQKFIARFTKFVVSTYASALRSYNGEKIKFFPIRSGVTVTDTASVTSRLLLNDRPSVKLEYDTVKKNGQWLIKDFSVDGMGFVTTYRNQINDKYRKEIMAKRLDLIADLLAKD